MSDPLVHRCSDSAGKIEQSMHSYHSDWVSHWTKRTYDAAIQNCISSSNSLGKKGIDHGNKEYLSITKLETASNSYGPVKRLGKIETGTSKVTNGGLRMTSTAIRNENPAFPSFPTIPCQSSGRSSALKDCQETCNREVMKPQMKHILDCDEPTMSIRRSFIPSLLPMAPDVNDTSSRECHSEPDDVSQNPKEPVKTLALFTDGGFDMPGPWPVDFTASTSHIVQRGFDHGDDGSNLLPSYIDRPASASKEQLPHANLRFLERDNQRDAAILVCEEKTQSQSKTERSECSYLRQDKESFLQTNPSIRNNHSPALQNQDIQNFSGFRLFQNQSKLPEVTKSQKLHQGYSSVPKFLCSIHDVETMRICTTVDSVVGLHGGPRFSQTTHSLLITKKTDFNFNKENKRNSSGIADGNAFNDLHDLSAPFGDGKKGVKLQSLGGFKDSAVEENAENVKALSRFTKAEKTDVHGGKAFHNYMEDKGKKVEHGTDFVSNLKNESSAETDMMELDEKNQLSGLNSSPSNKVIRLGSAASRLTLGSSREVGYGQHNSSGMNFELPTLPTAGKMSDNGDPSTSRTESLDMETLLANAEQLSHSASERCLGDSAKPDPSCIWVKRLKLSASDSFVGTKSSKLGASHKKSNLVLARTLKDSTANSEPTVNRRHGKELMVLDKSTALSRCGESLSSETSNGGNSLLSHSWIQRWRCCQAATPKKKPEPVVVCEPQSSKLAEEDLQKKQFPSIAAMALMGKAMSGFQPCQFQNKGSFVVWN